MARGEKMSKLIDFNFYPIKIGLKNLLKDKTTKKNIIWATNTFEHFGREFDDKSEITEFIFKNGFKLIARVDKSEEAQLTRTRKKAEVFTPGWIVNEMNNYIDEVWFGRRDVFNIEDGETWKSVEEKIEFPEDKTWKKYIDSRRIEITCGEGPYLVSRYDVASGEKLEIKDRIGILDRKLRIVNENTETKDEWIKWATRGIQSTYGFEYQGDNLLIARINILLTFVDYFEDRWGEEVSEKLVKKISNIIAWNIWQMDGLTDMVPFRAVHEDTRQMNFFDLLSEEAEEEDGEETIYCRIKDWRGNYSILFKDYKEKEMKKFDFVIGNPPYQEDNDKRNRSDALYNIFMENSFKISDRNLLITPARFLFNVGSTPRKWNEKMLNDPSFKILKFIQDSERVFPGTDIKGGVAISYRDANKNFGSIETFTPFEELRSVLKKVENKEGKENLGIGDLMYVQNKLDLKYIEKNCKQFLKRLGSNGRERRLVSSIFDTLNEIFYDSLDKYKNKENYIQIVGRQDNERVIKWVLKDFIEDNGNLHAYKVILPAANGSGAIGEVLSTPLIGEPLIGHTQTFISIGNFKTYSEAEACFKYIKSKFARAMLGIKKVTQNNKTKETWSKIPLQDFTNKSDIDWTKSISEIDRQLYAKYNLSQEEIDFIEKNVKEME